jgi:hypothetical protein
MKILATNQITYTANKDNNKKTYKKPQVTQYTHLSKTGDETKYLIGATIGAVLGVASINMYNDHVTKYMLENLKQEIKADDNKSIKIEDINDDKTPEIILEKTDGFEYVYDMKSGKISIKDGDELIELLD